MKLQDFYDFLVREEAYEASSLNCFAFRHGYDVRQCCFLLVFCSLQKQEVS